MIQINLPFPEELAALEVEGVTKRSDPQGERSVTPRPPLTTIWAGTQLSLFCHYAGDWDTR